MTRYAVGDIQGCLHALQCLLKVVTFNPQTDQLWLVGDLINRGPQSLETLRFIKNLGACTRIVLGNHDLHFLAVATGCKQAGKSDTFDDILAAPDCQELIHWLQQQALFYSDPSGDYHMVHAGIPPTWTIQQASDYAKEVEAVINSPRAKQFYQNMYGNQPNRWHDSLEGTTRLRVITNTLTRMRFCHADGSLDLNNKLTTTDLEGYQPWFSHPTRLSRNNNIIFGHWAAIEGKTNTDNVFALDTGCVWGRHMTLMNLETQQLHHCDCANKN